MRFVSVFLSALLPAALAMGLVGAAPAAAQSSGQSGAQAEAQAGSDAATRGAVLFAAGGCANCHTDAKNKGPSLGGGAPIETPFGTFYPPNISSDPAHGIGNWSDADFIRAMRDGVSPEGDHYYPSFPYTAFTNLTDDDMLAIKAHIDSLPPVARPSRPHELSFPFNIRLGMIFWKWLYLDRGPMQPDPAQSAEWNRGRYLAEGLAHCAECHTPRTMMGGLDHSRWMAGTAKGEGPDGLAVPNITPHADDGIGQWSEAEIADALGFGMLPDGDFFGSLMADVVTDGTDKLSAADRRAIAVYLKSLPPLPDATPAQ